MKYAEDNYYQYEHSGMIICGECLTADLEATRRGDLVGDERVYPGMFVRLKDDHVEAYQCDGCLKQNEPYEQVGIDPDTCEEVR